MLTFAGLPAQADLKKLSANVALLGIPHGTPYVLGENPPTINGTEVIRKESVRYPEDQISWDFDFDGPLLDDGSRSVVDCGDVPGDPADPVGNRDRAQRAIHSILENGATPVVFGGDDSISIPVFAAFEEFGPIHILQIDAHIDWRDEIDGVKYGFSSNMRRAAEMPWVDKLIQVGMRGVGTARSMEYEAAMSYGSQIVTAQTVHKVEVEEILDIIPGRSSVYITMDCDGLDPSVLPAVTSPAPGGLTYNQVIQIIHGVCKKTKVAGFNLMGFVPSKDINSIGSVVATRILWNVIGALVRSPFQVAQ